MKKMKRMFRFEEKAFIRQRFLEAKNKTMKMTWMLHEWIKKNEKPIKNMFKDDIVERK